MSLLLARLGPLWFPISASIPTATFLFLGLFTGPTADDFCYAGSLAEHGYWEAMRRNYLEWQGRYASSSILFLVGYLEHRTYFAWYWLIPTALILATPVALYVLVRAVNTCFLERALGKGDLVTASLVLTSIYLVSLDRPSEVIYWFSGSATYHVPNLLFVVLLAALVRLPSAQAPSQQIVGLAASALLVVMIIGHNETIMVVTLSLLGSCVLLEFFSCGAERPRRYRAGLLCLFLLAVIGSLVVVLAPGNELRIQYETVRWGMNKADSPIAYFRGGLVAVAWSTLKTLGWLLTQPYHCFAVLLAFAWVRRLPARAQQRLGATHALWLPGVAFAAMCAAALTSFTLGIRPAPRATASVYVIFWLSVIPSGVILMNRYGWEIHGRGLVTVFKVALVGALLLHPRYVQSIEDSKNAVVYRLQIHEREQLVSVAIEAGLQDVVVPRLMRTPATIHYRDLSEDHAAGYNVCYAAYRGLTTISARGEGDTARLVRELREKTRAAMDTILFRRR